MSDIITIGVIGLGNAGSPILNNLYKSKKYNIVAFDIDKNKLIFINVKSYNVIFFWFVQII